MFEESLIESTNRIHTNTRRTAAFSLALQAAIAATIIMVPLLHPDTIKHLTRHIPNLVAPVPPVPPTPPPQIPRLRLTNAPATSAPAAPAAPAQPSIADLIRNSLHAAPDAPPTPGINISAIGVGNGTTGTPTSVVISESPGPLVHAAAAPSRVRLSTGITSGMLVSPIRPIYPHIAQVARIQGSVVIDAIISKSGAIESAHVISGPPMPQPAALDAVRNARYHPYLLSGEPTEVATTITVNFRLGD